MIHIADSKSSHSMLRIPFPPPSILRILLHELVLVSDRCNEVQNLIEKIRTMIRMKQPRKRTRAAADKIIPVADYQPGS